MHTLLRAFFSQAQNHCLPMTMPQLPGLSRSPFYIADGARGDIEGEVGKALTEANLATTEGSGAHQPEVCPVPAFIVLQGPSLLLLPILKTLLIAVAIAIDGASAGLLLF